MKNIGSKTLETERLILRKFTLEDAQDMFNNWTNDYEVSKMLFWDKHETIETTENLLNYWINEYEKEYTYRWVVQIKETNEIIGSIDIVNNHVFDNVGEIGYCYGSKYWGKGYAAEALRVVLEFLLNEAEYRLVEAKHIEDNPNSGKVMLKAGMKYDGRLRHRSKNKETNKPNDLLYYSITKDEL